MALLNKYRHQDKIMIYDKGKGISWYKDVRVVEERIGLVMVTTKQAKI